MKKEDNNVDDRIGIICFVISTQLPYKYDINRMLSLPKGLYDHTRWRSVWVSDALRLLGSKLKGQKGLILFKNNDDKLYPLRWVKILDIEDIGDVFYYQLILGDIVQYDEKESVSTQKIDTYNQQLITAHGNEIKMLNVFNSTVSPTICSNTNKVSELQLWGNIIKVLSQVSSLQGDEFIKILDITTINGSKKVNIKKGQLIFNENMHYLFKLLQQIPNPRADQNPPEPHEIELTAPADHIKVLKPKQSIVGKYDFVQFVMKTNSLKMEETTFIEMSSKTKNDPYIPNIFIPVKIIKNTFWLIARIVLGLFALWFIIFPQLFSVPENIVNNIALVVFILSISGKIEWVDAFISLNKKDRI